MEVAALASGSSGNCFYVENNGKGILIDAGISSKQIVDRMHLLKKNPEKVRGIFITHEHSDHIRGADVFARHFRVPIFVTKKTAKAAKICSNVDLIKYIKNNETMEVGGMKVEAFSKSHKAADPVSYNVWNGKKVSIITDLGYGCENVISHISDSDFLFMESNHDEIRLERGPYPYFIKEWIKSDTGHLSNLQAALCVLEHGSPKLKHIVLSHLSKTNNTEKLAMETFDHLLKQRKDLNLKVSLSMREKPTSLFKL
ncbi:MAG: MBL fold metallo-hydrolase [Nanoarchaeota archaeon]|nr:MBL fold metallo-hydrolase [Nanoarchaeota archaeon]